MNKKQLKQLMRPMIKECIHEILIEEGLLSNIVSEVAKGLQPNTITETVQHSQPARNITEKAKAPNVKPNKNLVEHRQKLLDAINKDAYNGVDLFEDTTPFTGYESQDRKTSGGPDLGDPRDAGVDISSVMGMSSEIWKRMK
jgi:hypothetical protein